MEKEVFPIGHEQSFLCLLRLEEVVFACCFMLVVFFFLKGGFEDAVDFLAFFIVKVSGKDAVCGIWNIRLIVGVIRCFLSGWDEIVVDV